MKVQAGITAVLMLGLSGCEYAADPDELAGEYRRPSTNEYLILQSDGTAIVGNLPEQPAEIKVRWKRSPSGDDYDCTWLDFEPITPSGVEWHTCANKVPVRNTVFIGRPLADPDEPGSYYEKVKPAQNSPE